MNEGGTKPTPEVDAGEHSAIATPWLTYAEAAMYTRRSVSTLQHLVSAKRIPVYGTRRSRWFRRDMLDLWIINPDIALRKWKEEIESGRPNAR